MGVVFVGLMNLWILGSQGAIRLETCVPGESPFTITLESGEEVRLSGWYCELAPPQPVRRRTR